MARSAVQRIFAVVCFGKLAWHPFLSPDLSSGALRALEEKATKRKRPRMRGMNPERQTRRHVAPALLVRKTWREGVVSTSTRAMPGNTATISRVLVGSTASVATPCLKGPAGRLGGRFQVGGFTVRAFLVNWRVPSAKPNQIVFESVLDRPIEKMVSCATLKKCRRLQWSDCRRLQSNHRYSRYPSSHSRPPL